MDLPNDKFYLLKIYCKIDQTFEDDMLKMLIDSASLEIARAISIDKKPEDFINDSRFFVALMQQVKEMYEMRGLGNDIMRYPLLNSVSDIINQIRAEQSCEPQE